jgi:hypothetical protein
VRFFLYHNLDLEYDLNQAPFKLMSIAVQFYSTTIRRVNTLKLYAMESTRLRVYGIAKKRDKHDF